MVLTSWHRFPISFLYPVSLLLLIQPPTVVSLANWKIRLARLSWLYREYCKGLSTQSWGAPELRVRVEEMSLTNSIQLMSAGQKFGNSCRWRRQGQSPEVLSWAYLVLWYWRLRCSEWIAFWHRCSCCQGEPGLIWCIISFLYVNCKRSRFPIRLIAYLDYYHYYHYFTPL